MVSWRMQNATTWMLPGEIFPTEVRATCHGISAATGKVRLCQAVQLAPLVSAPYGCPIDCDVLWCCKLPRLPLVMRPFRMASHAWVCALDCFLIRGDCWQTLCWCVVCRSSLA